MDYLRSLIFIPDNVKYLKSIDEIDEFTTQEDIIKKKIKSNPFNRDLIKLKTKKISAKNEIIKNTIKNRSKFSKEPNKEFIENKGKNYIKNLTGSTILIMTNRIAESGRNKGFPVAIEIKAFKDKRELTEEELNHPEILALYEKGKIVDVDYNEYKVGMDEVWKKQNSVMKARDRAIDGNIVDPITQDHSSVQKSNAGSISRISDDKESVAKKVMSGNFYPEEGENVIKLNGSETRGILFSEHLNKIESADDSRMSDSELWKYMDNF